MTEKDLKEFIYNNYYKEIHFTKEDSYYLLKKFRRKITRLCC